MKLEITYDEKFETALKKIIENDASIDEVFLPKTSVPYYDYYTSEQEQEVGRRERLVERVSQALANNTSIHTIHIAGSLGLKTWETCGAMLVDNKTIKKFSIEGIYKKSAALFANALASNNSVTQVIIKQHLDAVYEEIFFEMLLKNRSILSFEYENGASSRIKALLDYNQYQKEWMQKANKNIYGLFADASTIQKETITKMIRNLETELTYFQFDDKKFMRLQGLKFYDGLVQYADSPVNDAFFKTSQRFPEIMSESNDIVTQLFRKLSINDSSNDPKMSVKV